MSAELGIAPGTLQRWARAGKVHPTLVTPGGVYRWDRDDLFSQLGMGSGPADIDELAAS